VDELEDSSGIDISIERIGIGFLSISMDYLNQLPCHIDSVLS